MAEGANSGGEGAEGEAVPGIVRLMTAGPVTLPATTAAGTWAARQVERRPWLVAAGFLGLLGLFLLLHRGSRF